MSYSRVRLLGYYWVRSLSMTSEWRKPFIARFVDHEWRWDGRVVQRWEGLEVLSDLILPPELPKTPERIVAERILEVVLASVTAAPLEGENAELEFNREELLRRLEEVVR